MVSHCKKAYDFLSLPTRRWEYVKMLKDYIPVDIYGKCSWYLPRDETELLSQYKFYLAFENTECPEYVTEKLYKVLNSDISHNPPVPIVMGPNKKFYEENLPPKSFIHVDDFNNAEELGSYLNMLDSRDDLYLEYLNWKRSYQLVCDPQLSCKLCGLIKKKKSDSPYHETLLLNPNDFVISDLQQFWRKAKCKD